MGRPDIPVYSSAGGRFRDELHPSPHGTGSFGLSVFLRDGERVYRTYSTQGRGVDGVPLIDLTPYGRQESFEDSPEGWPQRETYSFGKVHDEYTADELAGLAAPSTTGEVYKGTNRRGDIPEHWRRRVPSGLEIVGRLRLAFRSLHVDPRRRCGRSRRPGSRGWRGGRRGRLPVRWSGHRLLPPAGRLRPCSGDRTQRGAFLPR